MGKTIADYKIEIEKINEKLALVSTELAWKNAILESSPGIIFVTEAWIENQTYYVACLDANPEAFESSGNSPEEIYGLGKYFGINIFHPYDFKISEQSYTFLMHPANAGKSFGGIFRYKNKDGSYQWGLGYARLMPQKKDQVRPRFSNCLIPLHESITMDECFLELMAANHKKAHAAIIKGITTAEMNVFIEVVRGNKPKTIAFNLHIDKGTVNVHKHNLVKKLGLPSMSALPGYGKDIGIA